MVETENCCAFVLKHTTDRQVTGAASTYGRTCLLGVLIALGNEREVKKYDYFGGSNAYRVFNSFHVDHSSTVFRKSSAANAVLYLHRVGFV